MELEHILYFDLKGAKLTQIGNFSTPPTGAWNRYRAWNYDRTDRLTRNQIINPDIKAKHADITIKGMVSNTALIMFIAAVPGGLAVAMKAIPGDCTRLMYALSPMYFVMYGLP